MKIRANRRQSLLIKKWFGSGNNPLDPKKLDSRDFTADCLLDMYQPTFPKEEEYRKPARDILWNLWENAGSPEKFTIVYYNP